MPVTINGNGTITPYQPPRIVHAISTGGIPVALTNNTYVGFGLSASVTPSASTSKILVNATIPTFMLISDTNECSVDFRLLRNGTQVFEHTYAMSAWLNIASPQRRLRMNVPFTYLDSPSTGSSVTYSIEARAVYTSAVVQVNNAVEARVTLMEVAA